MLRQNGHTSKVSCPTLPIEKKSIVYVSKLSKIVFGSGTNLTYRSRKESAARIANMEVMNMTKG